jgi:hypothetical protein
VGGWLELDSHGSLAATGTLFGPPCGRPLLRQHLLLHELGVDLAPLELGAIQ